MKHLGKFSLLLWLVLPVLLWWALRNVPLGAVWDTLSQVNPAGLLGLIMLDGLILFLFSSRAWLILRALGRQINYLSLAAYRSSAFAVSYFTPGQQFGGEPLQVYWLQRRHQVVGGAAVTTVALDKLFEVLSNFTFLMVGVVVILRAGLLPNLSTIGPQAVGWLVLLFLLPSAYLLALWIGRSPLAWCISHLPVGLRNRLKVAALIGSLTLAERQASGLLRRKPVTAVWLGLASGLIWLLTIAEYWLMVWALGQELTLVQTILALTAARLAFLTPLPGGLGVLEAGQVLAMQAIGLDPALGISVSLLIRARDVGLGLVGVGIGALLARQVNRVGVSAQTTD